MNKIFAVLALLSSTIIHASHFKFNDDVIDLSRISIGYIGTQYSDGMTEDEMSYYQGRKDSEGKINFRSSQISSEGKFTAFGFHIALDLNEINTSDNIAKTKKDFVGSVIEFSKLKPSQQLDFNCKETKEYFDIESKLHYVAYNEVKSLKILNDSILIKRRYLDYINLLIEHTNHISNCTWKLREKYTKQILEHGISVLNDESANSIYSEMLICSNLTTILGRFIRSTGFVGQIIKPSDWAISK